MITADQLHQLLAFGVKNGASDIHLKVDEPPAFRLSSGLLPVKSEVLSKDSMTEMVRLLLPTEELRLQMNTLQDYDGSYEVAVLRQQRRGLGDLDCCHS